MQSDHSFNPLKSQPAAILLGASLVSISILMHGGIIKLGKPVTPPAQPVAAAPAPQAPGAQPTTADVAGLRASDHVRGDKSARILLIEYSDLECPFCKRFHPTAQQAVDEYKGQVAWVYRHFPLDQLHPKARKLAEAVECANELGGNDAFWNMADKIFEQATVPDVTTVVPLAAQTGLNQNQFKQCLDSGKHAKYVQDDYQSGASAGVTGTPGNFLLDTKSGKILEVPGAVPYESLKSSIDSLIKS